MNRHRFARLGVLLQASLVHCRLFSVLVASVFLLLTSTLPAQEIRWATGMEPAIAYAKSTRQNLFVYLFTAEAAPCSQFQQETLRDPALIAFLNKNFVCVAVNATQQRAIAAQYGVFRVPTVLLLDPDGSEFSRFVTYYPADRLLTALGEAAPEVKAGSQGDNKPLIYKGNILAESFDRLHGWNDEASAANCTVQLSLVRGVVGSAFKVGYQLEDEGWSFVQFYRDLQPEERIQLPSQYTIIIHLAGAGGHNQLALKFIDEDFDNFGIILRLPTDNRGHRLVIPSTEIEYLWGKGNQKFDRLYQLCVAVQPDNEYREQHGVEPKGMVYLDELIIMPGIRTDIPASEFTGRIK